MMTIQKTIPKTIRKEMMNRKPKVTQLKKMKVIWKRMTKKILQTSKNKQKK